MGILLDADGSPIVDSDGNPLYDQYGPSPGTPRPIDFSSRLRTVLPARWFPDVESSPVLETLLDALEANWRDLYGQVTYAALQTRIATATGRFLDMAALDYLGGTFSRKPGQLDPAFSLRVRAEVIRPRVTRLSVTRVLEDLTGRAPVIFEPARPTDTGGYGDGTIAGSATGLAYANADGTGGAGGWGSLALHGQVFVTAYRATSGGIPGVGGYYTGTGWAGGGYGVGALEWADLALSLGQITDEDIYAAVESVMPAGGIAWTAIAN